MADRWEDFDEADFLDIDENVAQPLAHHSPKLPRHPAISGSLRNPSPQSVIRPPSRNFDSPPRSAASSRARGPNFHANRSSTLEDLRARNSQSPGRSQFARSMMEPPPTTRPTHEEQRQRLLQELLKPSRNPARSHGGGAPPPRISSVEPSVPDEAELGQKQYTQAMLEVLMPRDEQSAKEKQEKVKQQLERFQQAQKVYQLKREEKIKQLESKQDSQCPFKPKVSGALSRAGSAGAKPRSFEKFLRDQQEHQLKIEEKVKAQKALHAEKKDDGVRPLEINAKSRQMVEQRRQRDGEPKLSATERLFKHRTSPNVEQALLGEKKQQQQPQQQQTASSRLIPINEQKGHSSHLYQDALRRQKKMEQIRSAKPLTPTAGASQKSRQVVRQRLVKELRESVDLVVARSALLFGGGQAGGAAEVNFMQLQEVLKMMGFMGGAYPDQEKQLLERVWEVLARDSQAVSVSSKDLQTFLEAVQGVLQHQERRSKNPFGELFPVNEAKQVQSDDGGPFCPNDKEARKLQQEFNVFALNRREFVFAAKASQRAPDPDCSFRPALCDQSTRILKEQKREKDPVVRLARGHDLKKLEAVAEEMQQKREQDCTFRPKTNQARSLSGSKKRWEALYENAQAKTHRQKERLKERKEEIGRKESQNCTFHPSVLGRYQSPSKAGKAGEQKQVYEFVQRMNKARAKQAAVREAREKGWTLEKLLKNKTGAGPGTGIGTTPTKRELPPQLRAKPKGKRVVKVKNPNKKKEEKLLDESKVTIPESCIELPASDKQSETTSQLQQLLGIEARDEQEDVEEEEEKVPFPMVHAVATDQETSEPQQGDETPITMLLQDNQRAEAPMPSLGSPGRRVNDESVESEREPVLYVDVNLGSGVSKRITVFEGDTADALAGKFANEHCLDAGTQEKLAKLLQSQMSQLLTKIEEGESEDYEESQQSLQEDSIPTAEGESEVDTPVDQSVAVVSP